MGFNSTALKVVMAEKNVSNNELSDKMKVSKTTVSDWRRGVNVPSLKNLARLGKALGVDYKTLLN